MQTTSRSTLIGVSWFRFITLAPKYLAKRSMRSRFIPSIRRRSMPTLNPSAIWISFTPRSLRICTSATITRKSAEFPVKAQRSLFRFGLMITSSGRLLKSQWSFYHRLYWFGENNSPINPSIVKFQMVRSIFYSSLSTPLNPYSLKCSHMWWVTQFLGNTKFQIDFQGLRFAAR